MREQIKQYLYYFIIAIVSIFALAFLPMLGSDVGVGLNYPTTLPGIIVWWATKAIIATLNVIIFYSFMEQAKINIRDDEHYKEANEILAKHKDKAYKPMSPKKWNAKQYGSKGTTIFISSAMSVMALTQAILTFDYVSLFTYLFTIAMGIVFGILQMKKAEVYWTGEYYDYAKGVERNDKDERFRVEKSPTTSVEEPKGHIEDSTIIG